MSFLKNSFAKYFVYISDFKKSSTSSVVAWEYIIPLLLYCPLLKCISFIGPLVVNISTLDFIPTIFVK